MPTTYDADAAPAALLPAPSTVIVAAAGCIQLIGWETNGQDGPAAPSVEVKNVSNRH
jgi:hypothetical protein